MFKIFENGNEIGVADKLTFIKKADNGCFVLCEEDEAQGIAFNGETFTSWYQRRYRKRTRSSVLRSVHRH